TGVEPAPDERPLARGGGFVAATGTFAPASTAATTAEAVGATGVSLGAGVGLLAASGAGGRAVGAALAVALGFDLSSGPASFAPTNPIPPRNTAAAIRYAHQGVSFRPFAGSELPTDALIDAAFNDASSGLSSRADAVRGSVGACGDCLVDWSGDAG